MTTINIYFYVLGEFILFWRPWYQYN